jgi:hypothetical protein
MPGLSFANVESELSYAYLHAIAARANVACSVAERHLDNVAIDAMLTGWGPFPGGGRLTEVSVYVQLKATIAAPVDNGNTYSYPLSGISAYNHLREKTKAIPRLLVVLFLPSNNVDWLLHNEDELALRRCAYWVSLYDAPDTPNTTSVTVYIPKNQIFNAEGLIDIMTRLSDYGASIPYAGYV